MPFHSLVSRGCTALALSVALLALAGCGLIKPSEATAAVVTPRLVGMPAGEFFDRYGRASRRNEVTGGSTEYVWDSPIPPVVAGVLGPDHRVCRLRLSVDVRGRISTVQVLIDMQGRTGLSRCSEIFAAN